MGDDTKRQRRHHRPLVRHDHRRHEPPPRAPRCAPRSPPPAGAPPRAAPRAASPCQPVPARHRRPQPAPITAATRCATSRQRHQVRHQRHEPPPRAPSPARPDLTDPDRHRHGLHRRGVRKTILFCSGSALWLCAPPVSVRSGGGCAHPPGTGPPALKWDSTLRRYRSRRGWRRTSTAATSASTTGPTSATGCTVAGR